MPYFRYRSTYVEHSSQVLLWWQDCCPVLQCSLAFLVNCREVHAFNNQYFHMNTTGLSASSACLEKPSCLHILICTDAFVHHCCANLISRGSRTRHQTKAFKLKKTEVSTSHVLAWTWAGSSMATGPKQSAVNNRTWLILPRTWENDCPWIIPSYWEEIWQEQWKNASSPAFL